jgi:hypothetical protein
MHADARTPTITFHAHFLAPVPVQDDPVGESRETVFTRRSAGTTAVKTLAVPEDQPSHFMDLAYRIVDTR